MKHVFIINPAAGAKSSAETLRQELQAIGNEFDWEIYDTTEPLDATRYVRQTCQSNPDTRYRFYACGGDGTLNEVVTGAVGMPNASVSSYACGSGNDFVKVYGGKERFLYVRALLEAEEEEEIDLIRIGDRYSINVTNFGFDTCVARTMIQVRRKKILGGKNAYKTGLIKAILTARRNKCVVEADGEVLNPKGKILLCTLANGQYVGGAFRCAPRADHRDGMIDVCLFTPITLMRFLKLLGPYTDGKHLDDERFADCMVYRRAKSIHVKAPEGFAYSLDGEIIEENDFVAEIAPKAIRFALPKMPAAQEASSEVAQ